MIAFSPEEKTLDCAFDLQVFILLDKAVRGPLASNHIQLSATGKKTLARQHRFVHIAIHQHFQPFAQVAQFL